MVEIKKKNGVTDHTNTEPIWIMFSIQIFNSTSTSLNPDNSSNIKEKITFSKKKLEALVCDCMQRKKLSFVDTVLEIGVSPSVIRRICRTLKIGRYSNEISLNHISNSSQEPYGWKSVNGVLEKLPKEWEKVELIFSLHRKGLSLHKIAHELTEKGVATKNGGRWFAKTVSQIMKFNQKFLKHSKRK